MRRWQTRMSIGLVVSATFVAGCKSLAKNDNPVLQPPPRRVTMDDSEVETRIAEAAQGKTDVRQVSATNRGDDTEVFNARVVARVNGAPVFAGEVLDRYGEYLGQAKTKLTPEEYAQLRDAIIRRDLRSHIERRLLVERMKSKLKPEQQQLLNTHLDRMFESRIEELKKELKVETRTELELALNERGTNLATVRDAYGTERIAMEFLFSSLDRPDPPTRPQMVAYYQAHLNDYKIPARVKWQQVQVSVTRAQSRTAAETKIKQAREELLAGTPFADVARKYSDGPTASSGGEWDWTRAGSLADTDLDKKLFALPVGEISDIHFARGSFQVVQVIDRQPEGRTPFAEVQDEIEQKMIAEGEKDLPKKFIDKLYAEAIIETDYDYLEPQ